MSDQQLVLAVFADEAAADWAVDRLKSWDAISDDIKLGAIGVLVADGEGGIKEHKLGARSSKSGAGIGIVLAIVAPPTLLAGLVGGGVLGHFHHQGLKLSDEDRTRIGGELSGGKAAVGVLAAMAEAPVIAAKLTEFGGAAESHDVSDEALDAAATAAEPAADPAAEVPAATA